ncbi:MAG: polysaccharide deacetylase family protein [Clostridia bacterium]|nr:polysaccharide deacetylase family protein [Clostridia bacterium]
MRFFIITKRQIALATALIVCAVIAIIGSLSAFADRDRLLPIYSVDTNEKKIAISFDAAWGNDDTHNLIEILKEYEVPATFFVVGAWVDKYPESVKELADAGHRVQNHSNTHPYMTQLSKIKMTDEITSCNDKIEAITGTAPTLFRPPYGDYDNAVIETVNGLNMHAIQWSIDSLDWQDSATAESIYKKVTSKAHPGAIVLFHNDAEHTPEALPNILKTLKEQGYEFVFIDDLIYKDNYEIKYDGTQCKTNKAE